MTKCAGYTVDDSLPFLTPTGSQSDVDFVAVHPGRPPRMALPDSRTIRLKRHLGIEVKGWPDSSKYSDTAVFNELIVDLNQINASTGGYVPEADWSHIYFSFITQPAYEIMRTRLGTRDFQRIVFITPKPRPSKFSKHSLGEVLEGYAKFGIYFVWLDDVMTTLFQYAGANQHESRRNITLELLRYLRLAGFTAPGGSATIKFE